MSILTLGFLLLTIGKYIDGLKNNTDGSLDIYVQRSSPGADKESNWLPAPDDQAMNIEYSLIKSVQSSIRNLIESFRDKTNR